MLRNFNAIIHFVYLWNTQNYAENRKFSQLSQAQLCKFFHCCLFSLSLQTLPIWHKIGKTIMNIIQRFHIFSIDSLLYIKKFLRLSNLALTECSTMCKCIRMTLCVCLIVESFPTEPRIRFSSLNILLECYHKLPLYLYIVTMTLPCLLVAHTNTRTCVVRTQYAMLLRDMRFGLSVSALHLPILNVTPFIPELEPSAKVSSAHVYACCVWTFQPFASICAKTLNCLLQPYPY